MSSCFAAASVALAFVIMCVSNALTFSRSFVPNTNGDIALTHPVYLLPAGYAFAIWGMIYILELVFTVYQALPAARGGGLEDPDVIAARPAVVGAFVSNSVWLFLFDYEQFWPALVVIVLYDLLLFRTISVMAVHYLDQTSWLKKLGSLGFSVNASWVTVASLLSLNLNLLDAGWPPAPDFAAACLASGVAIAAVAVYSRADVGYAAAAAWALSAIAINQQPSSDWGCSNQVCPPCQRTHHPHICDTRWKAACSAAEAERTCFLDKSPAVAVWACAGIVVVSVALLAAIHQRHKRGAITQPAEFEGKKAELLARL